MIKHILYLFSIVLFINCSDKKTENPVKQEVNREPITEKQQNQQKIEELKKEFDRRKIVDFLKVYGKENPETVILFKTRLGNIKVKLYKNTPLHRASFIFLVKEGYFNTTCVHRVVKDFVVQGGNSENPKTRKFRKKYDRYTLPAEFRTNRKHKYGALAAARDWENNPNKRSTPFEFYFVQNKNGSHHLNGEHTIFGEIISGFETLEKIAQEEVGNDEWPKNDVFFEVEVVK